jgi:hypothetical protein
MVKGGGCGEEEVLEEPGSVWAVPLPEPGVEGGMLAGRGEMLRARVRFRADALMVEDGAIIVERKELPLHEGDRPRRPRALTARSGPRLRLAPRVHDCLELGVGGDEPHARRATLVARPAHIVGDNHHVGLGVGWEDGRRREGARGEAPFEDAAAGRARAADGMHRRDRQTRPSLRVEVGEKRPVGERWGRRAGGAAAVAAAKGAPALIERLRGGGGIAHDVKEAE